MTEARIKELVDELRSILSEVDWLGRDQEPRLRDPATDEEIAALEKEWGRKLPPSYESFLRIANGLEGLDQYDWGLAGATPPSSGETFDDVKAGHIYAFKQKKSDHPVVTDLEQSHVAGSNFDYEVVYFDPATLDREEPMLRRIGLDVSYEHYPVFENFTAFLEFVVEVYNEVLEFQNEPFDDGAEDLGPISKSDEAFLMELASLLDGKSAAPEPEPEPVISPEMQLASRLCSLALQKLIDRELVELVDAPSIRENLEDYMLRKLLRSKSPAETTEAWINALSKAREVEELYGTDAELETAMLEAFEEIAAES